MATKGQTMAKFRRRQRRRETGVDLGPRAKMAGRFCNYCWGAGASAQRRGFEYE